MLKVMRQVESTPTVALDEALAKHQGQFAVLKWGLVLRVVPRPTATGAPDLTPDAWYDLAWSIPALCVHPDDMVNGCREYFPLSDGWLAEAGAATTHVGWHDVQSAGTLPVPPVIPSGERLAAAPVTEDMVDAVEARQPGATAFHGGRDGVRRWLETNRNVAVTYDKSADRFDWDAFARQVVERYRSLTPPTLGPLHRVQTAGARCFRAAQETEAARASAEQLVRNAEQAGVHADFARWTGVTIHT